ncbi:hypothetical protein [Fodinicola acaciae]|uniref:hypothetical protein n=1 Tax=Fodinicola acaciae TaxID=2681555 RepID=UPI0013D167AF|nr:hypothetical protein [Fodinicola acaciae]
MPLDLNNTEDVQTIHIDHPRDALSLIGKRFVSPWFSMDHDRAELWEQGTYLDLIPDAYYEEGYGDGLVEGYHLLGMLDYLMNQVLTTGGRWVTWNYGLDRVRFVSVIRERDRFRLTGSIVNVEERKQGFLVTNDIVAEVHGREKPGFIATQLALWTTIGEPDPT